MSWCWLDIATSMNNTLHSNRKYQLRHFTGVVAASKTMISAITESRTDSTHLLMHLQYLQKSNILLMQHITKYPPAPPVTLESHQGPASTTIHISHRWYTVSLTRMRFVASCSFSLDPSQSICRWLFVDPNRLWITRYSHILKQ